MYESKDIIRNRMMRHISRLWGYPGIESEDAFDPVLGMLIGACAAELEKINKEIVYSQNRLTEKVAQLFVPEAEIKAIPAHTVIHIPSSNLEDTIDADTTFICNKTIESPENVKRFEEKSISFIPTIEAKIHNADIKYLITNEFLYKQMEGRYKDVLAYCREKRLNDTSFYIGIAYSSPKTDIDSLSIFFELDEKGEKKDLFFNNFKYARFSINGKPVKAYSGFRKTSHNMFTDVFSDHNLLNKKTESINDIYAPQFINIEGIKQFKREFKKCPDEITNNFDDDVFDAIEDNVLWLKIDFPSIIQGATLAHLSCHLNCVPAINTKRNTDTMNLQPHLNIKAIVCSDYFYEIQSVEDNNGMVYGLNSLLQEENGNKHDDSSSYEYVLRNTGVGRLDQRKASEMLQDLINALKEESVAFSMHNTSNLVSHTQELNKHIAALENITGNKSLGDNITYIMLRGNKEDENKHITIRYWETAGNMANDIKKGTNMKIGGNSPFSGKNATLLVRTQGGRGYLSGDEKLQAFKNAYVANNRIVTMKDVEDSVKLIMGNRAKNISVKKSIEAGTDLKHGFIRIVKVDIEPNPQFLAGNSEEFASMEAFILDKLQSGSSSMMNFRVSIKKA